MISSRAIFISCEMDALQTLFAGRVTIVGREIAFWLVLFVNYARLLRIHIERAVTIVEALGFRREIRVLPLFTRATVVVLSFHSVGFAVPATVLKGATVVLTVSSNLFAPRFNWKRTFSIENKLFLGFRLWDNRRVLTFYRLLVCSWKKIFFVSDQIFDWCCNTVRVSSCEVFEYNLSIVLWRFFMSKEVKRVKKSFPVVSSISVILEMFGYIQN